MIGKAVILSDNTGLWYYLVLSCYHKLVKDLEQVKQQYQGLWFLRILQHYYEKRWNKSLPKLYS